MSTLRKDGTWRIWSTPNGLEFRCDVIGGDCKLNSGLAIEIEEEEFFEAFYQGLDLAAQGLQSYDELQIDANAELMEYLAEEEDTYITYVKNGTWRIWSTPDGIELRCDVIGNKCKRNSGIVVALDETELELFFPSLELEEIELEDPETNVALMNYLEEREHEFFFE